MKRIVLPLVCVAALSGCASINGFPEPVIPAHQATAEVEAFTNSASKEKIEDCLAKTDDTERQACRNEIVDARLYAIDAVYFEFERTINSEKNITNVGADAALLTLGGLGTTAVGVATKTALAAASTGIVGIRGSYDKAVLAEKTISAIVSQMNASRAAVRAAIETGKQKGDYSDYTLGAALSDVLAYQQAGTVPSALDEISKAAAEKSTKEQGDLKTLLTR